MDEARLAERCKQGDAAGVREFLEHFQRPVFSVCLRWLGHRQDAEDVTQETLLRAVRHLTNWDSSRPLTPWVMAIALNRCRTCAAKRNRRGPSLDGADRLSAADVAPTAGDLNEELQRALLQLREDYRTCFVMFYQDERSCLEIAQVLNCPEGTVKTWLHRARKELAEILRRRGVVTEEGYELRGL